jgi:soluble lytic murein transglycosylase-like protein
MDPYVDPPPAARYGQPPPVARCRPRLRGLRDRLRRATASATAGGMMLVGLPFALEYVVRPGDTLSEIAVRHDTTVRWLVVRNDLHRSGDRIVAGQSLRVPGGRGRTAPRAREVRRVDPDARRIVRYTVRPGDTPSGLAVRFHAWTAELIEMNGSVLRVGERIRIPVVVAAVAAERRTAARTAHRTQTRKAASPPRRAGKQSHGRGAGRRSHRPRAGHSASRATVRRVVAATARRHGVDPDLALAVSWQEAGWQMHHTSSAGAIGAMQVMPATGRWMSQTLGRPLHLRDLHDNATAGVVLLKVLLRQAPRRVAVAGYYQGLAGVRRHGMYDDTKRYVANVLALKRAFARGHYP